MSSTIHITHSKYVTPNRPLHQQACHHRFQPFPPLQQPSHPIKPLTEPINSLLLAISDAHFHHRCTITHTPRKNPIYLYLVTDFRDFHPLCFSDYYYLSIYLSCLKAITIHQATANAQHPHHEASWSVSHHPPQPSPLSRPNLSLPRPPSQATTPLTEPIQFHTPLRRSTARLTLADPHYRKHVLANRLAVRS